MLVKLNRGVSPRAPLSLANHPMPSRTRPSPRRLLRCHLEDCQATASLCHLRQTQSKDIRCRRNLYLF